MSYRKSSHTVLQQLTMIARRAHKWAMVQPTSLIIAKRHGVIVHVGVAY